MKTQLGAKQKAGREEKKALNAAATTDSFQNFALKLGIGTDTALSSSTYGFNPITRVRTLLEWIYRGSWLGQLAVDLIANDMTRAGVTIQGDMTPEDMEDLEEDLTMLKVWDTVEDGIKWARLYGGSILVILIDGQDVETPLNMDAIGPGQFKGLIALDRWMVEPTLGNMITDLGPDLGMPKYYKVTAIAPSLVGKKIHYSRVVRMDGVKLPYWQKLMENMWGISVYEPLYDRLVAFDSATQGAAQLTYKSHLRTMKVKDFREIVAAGGKAVESLARYIDMMRRFQSNEGVSVIDAEDDFQVESAGGVGSGIPDILLRFGEQISGALQIPLVRLFGQSPAGLSSSGESDLRTYYDGIAQRQKSTLLVGMTKIYRIAAISSGIISKGFRIKFKPLWQLTDVEKGNIVTAVGTSIVNAFEAGIIDKPTAMRELRQSSEVTGIFGSITDDMIQQAELEPPPIPDMGAPGAPGGLPGMPAVYGAQQPPGQPPAAPAVPVTPPKPAAF